MTCIHSNSEWISFIDSDDWVDEEYFEVLFGMCHKYHTKCSIVDHVAVEENVNIPTAESIETYENCLAPDDVYGIDYHNIVQACGKLYHIDLFRNIRYPVGRINEDRFTTHKLLFQCDYIAISSKALYYYFQSRQSITRSKWTPKKIDCDACEEQLAFFKKNNYNNAYRLTATQYVSIVIQQLGAVEKDCENEHSYFRALKKRLKRAFKIYKRVSQCNIERNYIIYNYLYPGYVKFYNLKKTAKQRLMEKGIFHLVSKNLPNHKRKSK